MTLSNGRAQVDAQAAAIGAAGEHLAAFVTSTADGVETAARAAEAALRAAVATGASVERVAAELELSSRALRAIIDGSVALRSLHPDAALRPT